MKVFVVSTHYESADNGSTTTINGVHSSLESAQKFMKECFECEKKAFFDSGSKIEVYDKSCSIYDIHDSYHYSFVEITECELED